MPSPVQARTTCRVCHGSSLELFLDLGDQPPANALLTREELAGPEPKFPLALNSCRTCGQMQTTHVVSADMLFRNYVYFSSVSQAMATHFGAYAKDVADRFVPRDGLVVEIGSNDGILLKTLLGRPLRVLGVDPARNVAEVARQNGVPTLAEFFNRETATAVRKEHGPASAVIANNVFAHIDDLDSVMQGLDALLSDDGVFVTESPYVVPFLEHLEFDTVYHEHVSYWGVGPLEHLFNRFGFEVFDVWDQPVHGGTIRTFARRKAHAKTPKAASVAEHLALEAKVGIGRADTLKKFARDVAALREKLTGLVQKLTADGKRVVGYTAPAKGNVLLNYCNLGPKSLAYLADATPAKQGLFNPGMHIPIQSPEHFRADKPDYAVLLAWNHQVEILEKEKAWRAQGGKFIIPVPDVDVV
ncbi:MAG: class I SAM-dependent methyltransferase [Myxococcaceae bacterium]|nr:class I SAM-dependent methyltransferase [Myxococcaceae bacterium]